MLLKIKMKWEMNIPTRERTQAISWNDNSNNILMTGMVNCQHQIRVSSTFYMHFFKYQDNLYIFTAYDIAKDLYVVTEYPRIGIPLPYEIVLTF